MKRGVLNYSITWNENDRQNENIYFSKFETIAAYIDLLRQPERQISSLTVYEIPRDFTKPAENITGRINKFIY